MTSWFAYVWSHLGLQMVLSETAETRTGEDFVQLGTLKMLLDSQIKVCDSSVKQLPAIQMSLICFFIPLRKSVSSYSFLVHNDHRH